MTTDTKGLVEARGDVALWDREKGAVPPVTPTTNDRWMLTTPTGTTFYTHKADGRKALRAAARGVAPTAGKAAESRAAVSAQAAPEAALTLGSADPSGFHTPSLWRAYGGRFGLMVHCGIDKVRIVCNLSGGHALHVERRDKFFADEAAMQAEVKAQAAMAAKLNKDIVLEPGDMWWPALNETVTQYLQAFDKSYLAKTPQAAAAVAAIRHPAAARVGSPATAPPVDDLLS